MEKASLLTIPEEYVLIGLSMYFSMAENSMISASFSSISFLLNP